MRFDQARRAQAFSLQLTGRMGLVAVVAALLLGAQEVWARTTKSPLRSATINTLASSPSSKQKVQKSSPRRNRRHRRLKVSRLLKPMPALSEAPFSTDVPLLKRIEEAKSQLEKETVHYVPASRKLAARRDVKLALAHFKTGEIHIVSGVEQNRKLTLDDPNVRFEVDWWNGFNSSITIIDPPYTGVVAMLYSLEPERQKFLNQDAIIYTPYSSALLQTELVEAGKSYLMEKIQQARQELGNVPSRAFPGMSLAQAPGFSNEDYFNLILTEQMDPGRFRSIAAGSLEFSEQQESELKRLAERILVIIGANQEDAYSFTGNYASARGLTQFTPMGMSVVWGGYPQARIPGDFREATSQHLSAIKAEICLLDHDLAGLSTSHSALIGSGMEMYAAGAAYNGGPKRVRYGLENFGLAWLQPVSRLSDLEGRATLDKSERKELLWLKRNRNHETFIYLNKIYAIQRSQEKLSAIRSVGLPAGNPAVESTPQNTSAPANPTTLNP